MPEFAHPFVLWLILPLLLGVAWRWFSTPASIAVSSTKHYTNAPAPKYFAPWHILLFLETLATIAFIVALARPQQGVELMPQTQEGTDIMLVLDYSNSMDAYDPDPSLSESTVRRLVAEEAIKDRLDVAREQIQRFVKRRSADRIGLVIFGVDAYLSCPPTLDHDHLIAKVDQLTGSLLYRHERGTNIAGGIGAGVNALVNHSESRRTMILITDGDHTVDDEVFTPEEAAEVARDKEITIHTVGIGSDNPFLDTYLRSSGASIQFDTRNLEKIAAITNGRFFRAKDNQGFEDVMDTIDALETTSRVHEALVFQRDLYPLFLICGAITLATAFLLRHTLLREIC